ncbi:hypothetical protein KY289_015938 [Solanum tuberosum]|nr:hypothetical protein KY284_015714 [Solanum tuberosum]KAH0688580.1 hypothetical protein KY289_015938 [Solanum tuberosum]
MAIEEEYLHSNRLHNLFVLTLELAVATGSIVFITGLYFLNIIQTALTESLPRRMTASQDVATSKTSKLPAISPSPTPYCRKLNLSLPLNY